MTDEEKQKIPTFVEIRTDKPQDEHVILFKEHYDQIKLPYKIIKEKTPDGDIDIRFFNYVGALIDNLGCPHKS